MVVVHQTFPPQQGTELSRLRARIGFRENVKSRPLCTSENRLGMYQFGDSALLS